MSPLTGVEEACFVTGASNRWEFLAFCGILPETYRAAPPLPSLAGGNLFAITVVDLGIIEVSSSYTGLVLEIAYWVTAAYGKGVLYLHCCPRSL